MPEGINEGQIHSCFERVNQELEEELDIWSPGLNIEKRGEHPYYYCLVLECGPHHESWDKEVPIYYCPFCGEKL